MKETDPGISFFPLLHHHLSQLSKEFEHYFPMIKDPQTGKDWIHDPLWISQVNLSVLEEDYLFEISNDGSLKSMFETTSNLHTFWIRDKVEYPEIVTKALKSLLPFPTSYFCEAEFLVAMTATKRKLWRRLDISNTFRVSLSPIIPRWDRLVLGKQALIPHYGELYNYYITHHNVIIIEIKCTINIRCLNHHEIISHPSYPHSWKNCLPQNR